MGIRPTNAATLAEIACSRERGLLRPLTLELLPPIRNVLWIDRRLIDGFILPTTKSCLPSNRREYLDRYAEAHRNTSDMNTESLELEP
jgi:hypothetical protein